MSHRRKHVTSDLLHGHLEPQPGQRIVRAIGSRGGNLVEVELPDGRRTLVLMPSRFNKKLWVKRGGYILIDECPEAEADGGTKVTGTILNVLYGDQIKDLKKIPGAWPREFDSDFKGGGDEETETSAAAGPAGGAVASPGVDDVTHSLERTAIGGSTGDATTSTDTAPGHSANGCGTSAVMVADGGSESSTTITSSSQGCSAAAAATATGAAASSGSGRCPGPVGQQQQQQPQGPSVSGGVGAGEAAVAPAARHEGDVREDEEGDEDEDDDDLPPLHQNTNRRFIYHEVSSDSDDEDKDGDVG